MLSLSWLNKKWFIQCTPPCWECWEKWLILVEQKSFQEQAIMAMKSSIHWPSLHTIMSKMQKLYVCIVLRSKVKLSHTYVQSSGMKFVAYETPLRNTNLFFLVMGSGIKRFILCYLNFSGLKWQNLFLQENS